MKTNRIELDKTKGLTITVKNGQSEQTIYIDGSQITITVKSGAQQSQIVQTPTSVTVTADDFIVRSKNVLCQASLDAKIQSGTSRLELTPLEATLAGPIVAIADAPAPPSTVRIGALTSPLLLTGATVQITAATTCTIKAPNLTEATPTVFGPPPIPPL